MTETSDVKMDSACSSERLLNSNKTTWHRIPADRRLHSDHVRT